MWTVRAWQTTCHKTCNRLPALLAPCEYHRRVDPPHQGPVMRDFGGFVVILGTLSNKESSSCWWFATRQISCDVTTMFVNFIEIKKSLWQQKFNQEVCTQLSMLREIWSVILGWYPVTANKHPVDSSIILTSISCVVTISCNISQLNMGCACGQTRYQHGRRIKWIYIVNDVVADGQATNGARASASLLLKSVRKQLKRFKSEWILPIIPN